MTISGKLTLTISKGGPGSGFRGHHGRPGQVGGSTTEAHVGIYKPGIPGGIVESVISPGNARIEHYGMDERLDRFLNNNLNKYPVDAIGYENTTPLWYYDIYGVKSGVKDDIITTISNRMGIDYNVVDSIVGGWAETANDKNQSALLLQEMAAEELGLELSTWQKSNHVAMEVLRESYDKVLIANNNLLNNPKDSDLMRQREQALEAYNTVKARYGIAPYKNVDFHYRFTADEARKFIRGTYDDTQNKLAEQGFLQDDYVTMYRGVVLSTDNIKKNDIVNYEGNVLDSWSLSPDSAMSFAESNWDRPDTAKSGVVFAMKVPVKNIISSARTGLGCLSEGEFIIAGAVPGSQAEAIYVTHFEPSHPYETFPSKDTGIEALTQEVFGDPAAFTG